MDSSHQLHCDKSNSDIITWINVPTHKCNTNLIKPVLKMHMLKCASSSPMDKVFTT